MTNRKRPGRPGLPFIIDIDDFMWLSFLTGLKDDASDNKAIANFAALTGIPEENIRHKIRLEKQEAFSELIDLIDPESETVH